MNFTSSLLSLMGGNVLISLKDSTYQSRTWQVIDVLGITDPGCRPCTRHCGLEQPSGTGAAQIEAWERGGSVP